MLPALEVSLDPHSASTALLLPARSASFQMVRSPPPPRGLRDAPLLGFLAPSAAFGLLRPQASCSLMSDVRFTSFPSVCSPTDVTQSKLNQTLAGTHRDFPRRALHPSKTCSSPTAEAPHDASCPPAVHNQRCRSHSIQTKTMLRSVCLVQSPKGPPPARMRLPVALSPTSPPRCALRCRMLHPHDASEHPLAKAVQGISSLPQPRHLTDAAVSVARPLWRPRLSSTLLHSSNRLASSP